jgi:phenylacetate-coenzyme A ligase PaaK-like adenylate-forming protein
MQIDELINVPQYSLDKNTKTKALLPLLQDLYAFHIENCKEFASVVKVLSAKQPKDIRSASDLPFLPVSAFKNHALKSIKDEDVFKVLTSSGTSGQEVSRIYLDKETARLQTIALSKIINHVVGTKRLPMLIVDSKAVFSNKQLFSARGAGILGLSVFGKDHTYILDENFEFSEEALHQFVEKYNGQPVLIFGFTFMVWLYLFQAKTNIKLDLSQAILIHSGGWKKLKDIAVDNNVFRKSMFEKFGITQIYNFYGMVEQVGSVFLENSQGYLHCPNFADVIIRNPVDFTEQPHGTEGLVQVINILPKSYPGFSLLTEDIGVIMGEDDAQNGWKGKYFKILGRAKKAELRGCSDTFKQK